MSELVLQAVFISDSDKTQEGMNSIGPGAQSWGNGGRGGPPDEGIALTSAKGE